MIWAFFTESQKDVTLVSVNEAGYVQIYFNMKQGFWL